MVSWACCIEKRHMWQQSDKNVFSAVGQKRSQEKVSADKEVSYSRFHGELGFTGMEKELETNRA